jgi:hypothetical protein
MARQPSTAIVLRACKSSLAFWRIFSQVGVEARARQRWHSAYAGQLLNQKRAFREKERSCRGKRGATDLFGTFCTRIAGGTD